MTTSAATAATPPSHPQQRTASTCSHCRTNRPQLKRPKDGSLLCRECFYSLFEEEVHQTIVHNALFRRGERVAIAVSGGKDSTVLAHVMKALNDRYDYGLDLFLLSVDEGITGYRDDSLETVKRNQQQYGLPLKIVSYRDLYQGWTMDEIVKQVGLKNNCSFCGVFRRQALDRGCAVLGVDKMVTGHNADDIAETVLMNILRGDINRLQRCIDIVTKDDDGGNVPRAKPFKYAYQKEIVMYAYFNKLDYFSTECVYAPNAYRGFARDLIKDLERIRPQSIIDILRSAENFKFDTQNIKPQKLSHCERCGYISSQPLCRACVFLDGLNSGRAKLAIYNESGRQPKNNKLRKLGLRSLDEERTADVEADTTAATKTQPVSALRASGASARDLEF